MTEDKYFSVINNEFASNLTDAIKNISGSNNFADITLVCEDDQIEAHKLILSASSDFFRLVLTKNPHPHPLVYLKGVKVEDMKNLLTYMYMGEVAVEKQHLNTFLGTAEDLKINGLVHNSILSDLKLSNENMFSKNSLIQKIIDHRVQKELKINLETLENSKRSLIVDDDDDQMPISKKEKLGKISIPEEEVSSLNSGMRVSDHEDEAKESMKQRFHENFNEDVDTLKGNDDGNAMALNFGMLVSDHEAEAKEAIIPSAPSIAKFNNVNVANFNTINNSVAMDRRFRDNFTEDVDTLKGNDDGNVMTLNFAKFNNFNVANFNTIDNSVAMERRVHDNFTEDIATIKGNYDGPNETELNQRINKEMEIGELTDKFTNEEKIRKIKTILADFTTTKMNGFYKCKICYKETKHSGHLKEHFEVHHIKTRRALFKCKFCGQPVKNSERLRKHAKICPSNVLRPVWSDLLMIK